MVLLKRFILILLSAGSFFSIFSTYYISEQEDKKLAIPFLINETPLVLESVSDNTSYGGAEAIIYNNSDQFLESVYMEIKTENTCYIFETTMLPPFERILLSERSNKSWQDQQIKEIQGYCKPFSKRQQKVFDEFIILQDRLLQIKNSDDEVLDIMEIYLKQWDEDNRRFTNRKTDKIVIRNIQPGDEIQIDLNDDNIKVIFVYINQPQHS